MIEHKKVFSFGTTGYVEQTSKFTDLPDGLTHTFVIVAGATSNNVTYTLRLRDYAGNVLFTKASIADGGTTILGPSSTENHEWPFTNGGSIGIEPSGDAGATHPDVTVQVYAVKL
jgi:hypothetical protein